MTRFDSTQNDHFYSLLRRFAHFAGIPTLAGLESPLLLGISRVSRVTRVCLEAQTRHRAALEVANMAKVAILVILGDSALRTPKNQESGLLHNTPPLVAIWL